ncbi:GMC family oxidoreductase [Kitasatospora sp. A2-31]|uniref:GMC family oxidoreductase n=1 Tax=Kitasatospora sp. A2-31 TaxID=2916414 RepID=UPI001EE9C30F|nr:GMC family oxidoreductase [Kitasatospora sp. A2-31]MCG6495523.1 GMC family oxidoreductase [Kitasatospora sp. A2-31]
MDSPYDVVIIGAGVAGALCACELKKARPDARILLLEAGANGVDLTERAEYVEAYQVSATQPTTSPFAGLPNNKDRWAPSSDGTGDPFTMNNYYVETGPDLFKSGFQRMVGGSTWAWRGNCPRFLAPDFALKSTYKVGADWPLDYDELEPFYARAETELGVSGNRAEWDGLTRRSTDFPMPGIVPSYGDEVVRRALAAIPAIDGTPVTLITNPQARNSEVYQARPACRGNSSCVPICPSGAKYDAGVHVRQARKLGVEFRTGSVAVKLLAPQDGGPATVVFRDWTTADRAEERVDGRQVVLALGAVETAKLWLLSELRDDSDQVGRNLMDHPTEEVVGLLGEPVFPFRGPQTTLSIETFRDGAFRKATGGFRMTVGNDGWGRTESPAAALDKLMWNADAQRIRTFGQPLRDALEHKVTRMLRFSYSTEQLPDRDNRVTLSAEKDALGVPRPKIAYRIDEYSKRSLAYAHSVARRIWQYLEDTAGADQVDPKQPTLGFKGSGHTMGTMRMGKDPNRSVVDPNGRAHGYANVWVIGASVFPTGGTANPTVTVAALTIRTAEKLAAAL